MPVGVAPSIPNLRGLWRNPLAFPAGRASGYDPGHIALANAAFCRISGVASSSGFVNLKSGARFTNASGPVSAIDNAIGPCLAFTSTAVASISQGGTDTSQTWAGIFKPTALAATNNWVATDSANNGIGVNTSGKLAFARVGTVVASTITISNNVPYFVVASFNPGTTINFLALRLDNGEIFTGTATASGTQATVATFYVGNNLSAAAPLHGEVAAVARINAYTPPAAMLQWAQDPWSFWYPDPFARDYSGAAGVSYNLPAAQGSYALAGGAHSLYGMGLYGMGLYSAAPWGVTLGVGMPASQGAYALSGQAAAFVLHLGHPTLAAAPGSYALSGQAATFPRAITLPAAHGSYALTGAAATLTRLAAGNYAIAIAQGAYALTGGTVTLGYTPAALVGKAQKPYLREGTYRVRQLGWAFDPTFVLRKDRPGPIRIIEFDGWMSG